MMKSLSELVARHIELGAADDQQQLIMLLKEAQETCGGSLSQDVLTLIADAEGREPSELCLDFPSIQDGIDGMQFVDAVVSSSEKNAAWVKWEE